MDSGPRYGSMRPPIAFGHRGARANAPENTIDSFRLARRLGASGLESDVWLTADKVAVLDHDGVVRSGLRRRPIASLRRAQLPGHIPTLEELLDACGNDYELSLDLKDAEAGAVVIDIVKATAPALLPRLWLCHPSWRAIAELRPLDDTVKLVDSTRLERIKRGPERRAADLRAAGIDAINMHHSDWTAGLVTLFHRFGRFTLAWDLQYDYLLQGALRMGIDGVYSDHVDRMVDAFRAEGIEVK